MTPAHTLSRTLFCATSLLLVSLGWGCGNPNNEFYLDSDSVTIADKEESGTSVSFDVTCDEYAGRGGSVCDGERECFTVYWMPEALTQQEQDSFDEQSVAAKASTKDSACKDFSETPETLTYTITPESAPPSTTVEVAIVGSNSFLYVVKPLQEQPPEGDSEEDDSEEGDAEQL